MPHIGFNVNNREPLLNPDFTPADMIDIGVRAEELGFDSVWVGDNLLEKPRLEPVATLATLASRTESVQLGTACMITTLRNPVQFAQAWATLDLLSDGRMLLGACMGTPDEVNMKQHEVVGVPPKQRHKALEEGIEVMKSLWTDGTVDYDGDIYDFEDVSFDTGRETIPFRPAQEDPPVLVISNPSLHGNPAVLERAVKRIVEIGDGWMTANRAHRPDEYEEQYNAIVDHAEDVGVDPDELTTAYQITFNINESREQAEREMERYLSTYYGIEDANYDSWGPVGTPDDVIEWIDDFHERGCDIFITRFGADDHWEQLDRLANEVLPSFQ